MRHLTDTDLSHLILADRLISMGLSPDPDTHSRLQTDLAKEILVSLPTPKPSRRSLFWDRVEDAKMGRSRDDERINPL